MGVIPSRTGDMCLSKHWMELEQHPFECISKQQSLAESKISSSTAGVRIKPKCPHKNEYIVLKTDDASEFFQEPLL